jgi:molecular chaperone HscB
VLREMNSFCITSIERIQETMDGLAAAFGANPPDLTRAKMLAIELQYLKNLERAAREWQPGKRVEVIH